MTYEKVPVIIPALNPDNRIFSFLNALTNKGFNNFVVIDDGSDKDITSDIFSDLERKGVKVITFEKNEGKGKAIKAGLSYVYDSMPDAVGVITADYDGRQNADAVSLVADKLLSGSRFVLGIRDLKATSMSKSMRRGYKLTQFVFGLLYDKKIKDIQTGLRGICYELIPRFLDVRGSRYEYEPKMMVEAVRNEIPIDMIDAGPIRPIGRSDSTLYVSENFRPFYDSFRISVALFLNFLEYALTSVSATVIDFILFYILSEFVFNNLELNICVLLSTALARLVSATLSFCINRRVVFKSSNNLGKTIIMFYTLAGIIMLCSAELVTLFVSLFGGSKTITKLFVDLCLFFLSYQIQQRVIFRKR